jgi:hypothetical protein
VSPLELVVVVSGIPASGKSTIARQIAPHLALPVVDKDELLEASFPRPGELASGDRQRLSREADAVLQRIVEESPRAVVASFWRRPELSVASGTPTDWLRERARVIEVHCVCEPTIAVDRFGRRRRHPAHGDLNKDPTDILAQFRALAALGPLGVGALVSVRTDAPVDPSAVARLVEGRL